ncbi:MAG TPA: hypothetical protein VKZ44_09615 [Taishania sp.]|nr:hypothetical protein [Taishania sp.]
MWQSSVFQISERPTPEILDLLTEVTLGTTGIRYKHLDTAERVHKVDHPLFFHMKRKEKVLGNITFCQRGKDWYIRYFAFRTALQRSTDTKIEDKSSSLLKREIEAFFQAAFAGEVNGTKVQNFYAFIDPKNDRSKWMSRNFHFETVTQLATQTFSRWFAKQSPRFSVLEQPNEQSIHLVREHFGQHAFFFDYYLDKDPMAFIKDENGELLAFARMSIAHWHIESLGGKLGEFKAKLLSKTPLLNRLVNPEYHTFSVPDSVYVKNNDPQLLQELFESIIAYQKSNMLIWWVDQREPLYQSVKNQVKWGPLHPILGVSPVDIVVRNNHATQTKKTNPIYVVGIDAI